MQPFKVHFLTKRIEKLVLIKVRASAICRERSAYCKRNVVPVLPQLPVTIKHEFSGDVVAIGRNLII